MTETIDLTCCDNTWTFVRSPSTHRWQHVAPPIDGDDPRLPDRDEVGVDAYVDAIFALPGQESWSEVLVDEQLVPGADSTLATSQRLRWPLRCSCGTNRPVRDERLQSVLDRASALGASALPLISFPSRVP